MVGARKVRTEIERACRNALEAWGDAVEQAVRREVASDAAPQSGRRPKGGAKRRPRVDPRVVEVVQELVRAHDLTPRETEILEAAVRGAPRKQMLASAGVTNNTFKAQVRGLVRKLKAQRLQDVVVEVLRDALVR